MKKFDVQLGNPPYQAEKTRNKDTKKGTCGTVIWDKFVKLCFDLVVENGYVCLVHPAGWRRPNQRAKLVGDIIKSKKILYLEMHSIADGVKTFGATTNYDWYVAQNCNNTRIATTVKDYSGLIHEIHLQDFPFIPNEQFEAVENLIAKNEKEKCEVLFSYSAYETRKPWMSPEKTEEFCHPCIYSLPMKGMQIWYSNTNKKGHFGVPKVIFTNGAASQVIVDAEGMYGLTQFAFGIVDDLSNLSKIKQAMESPKFIEFCKCFRFTYDRYDDDCIQHFRKDFWKEFL